MKDLQKQGSEVGSQIVSMRSGPLALSICMSTINKQGKEFDTIREIEYTNSEHTILEVRHCFAGRHGSARRIVVLENITLCQITEWEAQMRFKTNQRFSCRLRNMYNIILILNSFEVMFESRGPQIVLGPFFSRESLLKQKLTEFLEEIQFDHDDFAAKGRALWAVIMRNGSLSALCAIWEDLLQSEIHHRMIEMLPPTPMLAPAQ